MCNVSNQDEITQTMKTLGLFCHRPYYYARLKPRGGKAYENVSSESCAHCKTSNKMECVPFQWFLIVFVVSLSQSLLMVVVGFTFPDEEVPADFEPHYDDWLGESIESVEDWRSGPFYQHFPPQKGTFQELLISL